MRGDANPLDDPADAAALARHASVLLDAIDAALSGWVVRAVRTRWFDWRHEELPAVMVDAATAAGERARAEVVAALASLLGLDVDEQRGSPLSVIRRAVAYPTEVLQAAGVPAVVRDPEASRLFPDDAYDLAPASFAELDPAAHEPGLLWGAAKAHVVLRRRRRSD